MDKLEDKIPDYALYVNFSHCRDIFFRFRERSDEAFPFFPRYCSPEFSYEKIIQSYLFYIPFMINILLKFSQKKTAV